MWIRNCRWLTFKQHLIGSVPGYFKMLLVNGQHHLTLQYVKEGNSVKLYGCSFSRSERVRVVLGVKKKKLLIQTYWAFSALQLSLDRCQMLLPLKSKPFSSHKSSRVTVCTLELSEEKFTSWERWEWLWIGGVCVHVHVLHAYVGVHTLPYMVCQCSRWLRKWAGTTRGDCACASGGRDWLVPVTATDWRGLFCDPTPPLPPPPPPSTFV